MALPEGFYAILSRIVTGSFQKMSREELFVEILHLRGWEMDIFQNSTKPGRELLFAQEQGEVRLAQSNR